MSDTTDPIAYLRRCMTCLYIEVDVSIADACRAAAEAVIALHSRAVDDQREAVRLMGAAHAEYRIAGEERDTARAAIREINSAFSSLEFTAPEDWVKRDVCSRRIRDAIASVLTPPA